MEQEQEPEQEQQLMKNDEFDVVDVVDSYSYHIKIKFGSRKKRHLLRRLKTIMIQN
jgi:hypothetical protein